MKVFIEGIHSKFKESKIKEISIVVKLNLI